MPFQIVNSTLKKYEGSEEHVIIPEGIRIIDDYAFYGASAMKHITFPSTLEEIGNNAFYDCEALEEAAVPSPVYYLGDGIFSRCKNLKSVSLPDRLSELPKITFFQCEALENVSLPHRLKRISRSCFEQCHTLKSIRLPESLVFVDDNVFDDCTALESVNLPEGLKHIGDNAFFNCPSLNKLVLPSTLKEAGKGAFETRGVLELHAPDSFPVRSFMLDNNWNLNWNFGANGRYNGKNEDNYQLINSYLPNVWLNEWKPEAQCVLCINYLETKTEVLENYEAWIVQHREECLEMIISGKRYAALNRALESGLIPSGMIEPYLNRIHDPEERAKLLELNRQNHSSVDDLFDLLEDGYG